MYIFDTQSHIYSALNRFWQFGSSYVFRVDMHYYIIILKAVLCFWLAYQSFCHNYGTLRINVANHDALANITYIIDFNNKLFFLLFTSKPTKVSIIDLCN